MRQIIASISCLLFLSFLAFSCMRVEETENKSLEVAPVEGAPGLNKATALGPGMATSFDVAMESLSETMAPGQKVELGKTIDDLAEVGKLIPELAEFKLFCKYETSLSLMEEGKHCDLLDWKHGYTEWKDISANVDEKGVFELPQASPADRSTFPVVSLQSLKSAYNSHCQGHWAEKISKLKGPNEYPSGIGISRAILRLEGLDKAGNEVRQIFNMEMMMGC